MIGETGTIDQLWINLLKDPCDQSNVAKILEIGLQAQLFLTPQAAIVLDELICQGKEDCIAVLYPYIIKPSNEVLPVVQRWFIDCNDKSTKELAALLLAEMKHVFESAIGTLVDLLRIENDQMRYRVQRVFQHPERDVYVPSKRVSILGEKTLIKILENIDVKDQPRRVLAYLRTFFYDVLWDDPQVFQNIHDYAIKYENVSPSGKRRMYFSNRIKFLNNSTWDAMMRSFEMPVNPLDAEELLQSIMILAQFDQVTEDNWMEVARVLTSTDISQFRDGFYFSRTDAQVIQLLVNEICSLTDVHDETYFEILESKLISLSTVSAEDVCRSSYAEMNRITQCNFSISADFNNTVQNALNNIPLNTVLWENLIRWLIKTMTNFQDSWFSAMLNNCLLSLVAAYVQKDDYLYRKTTNASHFDKHQMINLLDKIVHQHSWYAARGNAFTLLAALDQIDHQVIIDALNTLFDENCVKEHAMIGMSLIHLSPNELLDRLLESLKSDSAVKIYEILKILTQFVLEETIDANGKSKIINHLANEIGQIKSRKAVNYYYTDVKIPFTTTLENELYKAWIKVQGLSGKTQYFKFV